MTDRKRRQPTPHFNLPPSFDPMTGEHAGLQVSGVHPYCAMMQVAAEDTHDDYVVCRGYDTRVKRFFDYDANDADKAGIAVAKPYGSRTAGNYQVGQMFAALLPLGRLGQTPSVAATSEGHPADLDEEVEILYDDNGKVINWMLVGAEPQLATMITALVNEVGNVVVGDLDFDIDGVTIIQPAGATEYPGGAAPTNVKNTLKFPANDDTAVLAWYDNDAEVWHGIPALATTVCP